MILKRGKVIKLNSDVVTKLDSIRNANESYSASVGKLLTLAGCLDVSLVALGRGK